MFSFYIHIVFFFKGGHTVINYKKLRKESYQISDPKPQEEVAMLLKYWR